MRSAIALGAILALLAPSAGSAAVSCPDRAPAQILAAAPDSVKCQKTISKQGEKFVKTKLKVLTKCLAKAPLGDCPDVDGAEKILDAAAKAAEKISQECGDNGTQGGLSSSYGDLTDDTAITSCMLSQHNASAFLAAANVSGIYTEDLAVLDDDTNKARALCMKELRKSGAKFISKALKNANKCIAKQMKDEVAGNLAPICVGQYSGGSFTGPSDTLIAQKQADLRTLLEGKIDDKCGDAVTAGYVASLFACAGATTVDDLKECVLCDGWNTVLDLLEQQYAETGTLITPGAGAIQAGVNAGTVGTKLLIASGTYNEEVTISTDGIQLVGCGGATDDRPQILPPGTPPDANGIFAANVDGLLFQSIEVHDFEDNDIFVSAADGVTFRDTITNGPHLAGVTAYGLFPVQSSNVLVEGCVVKGVSDAGIYVGQSTDIVIRHNFVEDNVAGIEIENSAGADVHNNHATGNTGGILIFKLPGLPVQLSNCHEIHHNYANENNIANYGAGTVGLVPRGTGFIVLSNDESSFSWNVVHDNETFGIAVTDQETLDFLFNAFSGSLSPDQTLEDNHFENNDFSGNGTNPDPSVAPFASDALFVEFTSEIGNCENDNLIAGVDVNFGALPACAGPPMCSVP